MGFSSPCGDFELPAKCMGKGRREGRSISIVGIGRCSTIQLDHVVRTEESHDGDRQVEELFGLVLRLMDKSNSSVGWRSNGRVKGGLCSVKDSVT